MAFQRHGVISHAASMGLASVQVGLDSKFFYPLVQRLPVPVYDYLSLHGHLAGLNHPAGAINGGK